MGYIPSNAKDVSGIICVIVFYGKPVLLVHFTEEASIVGICLVQTCHHQHKLCLKVNMNLDLIIPFKLPYSHLRNKIAI